MSPTAFSATCWWQHYWLELCGISIFGGVIIAIRICHDMTSVSQYSIRYDISCHHYWCCFILLPLHLNALHWLWQPSVPNWCTKYAKFYNFCATLLILRTTANSVQNSVHAESQNSDIPSLNEIHDILYSTFCEQISPSPLDCALLHFSRYREETINIVGNPIQVDLIQLKIDRFNIDPV